MLIQILVWFLVVAPLPPFIGADSTDSSGSWTQSWIHLQSGPSDNFFVKRIFV